MFWSLILSDSSFLLPPTHINSSRSFVRFLFSPLPGYSSSYAAKLGQGNRHYYCDMVTLRLLAYQLLRGQSYVIIQKLGTNNGVDGFSRILK